ncbi:MAG TPA: DUF167 family protein [Candidatus Binatia bacterium]|nr:DUF167 family protein [Candidatus Binatia bacterium]
MSLRVQPRASHDEIVGWQGLTLRVRVTAPPVDGEANAAVVRLLAAALGVSPSSVSVVRGLRGRDKLVKIAGMDEAGVRARLARSRSGVSDPRPDVSEPQPSVSEPRSGVSEPRPDVSERRSGVSEPQPDVSERRPGVSEPRAPVSGHPRSKATSWTPLQ